MLPLILYGSFLALVLHRYLRRYAALLLFPQRTSKIQPDKTAANQFPDPDPLLDFDLTNATARNHVYVNKTLRYPYFQVRPALIFVSRVIVELKTDNGTPTHAHQ